MKKRLIILFILISTLYVLNEGFTFKKDYQNNFISITSTKINNTKSNGKIISIDNAVKILQKNNSKCTYKLFTDTNKVSPFISENFYAFHVIENDLEYDSLYCVHKNSGIIYQYWPNGSYKEIK